MSSRRIGWTAILVLAFGCGGPVFDDVHRHVIGFRYNAPNYEADRQWNLEKLAYYREREWRFNRRDPGAPPALCLALSGGGSRAAAFSIGVMRGLHERGTLRQVDVLSATSGGAYAASWFYVQHLRAGGRPDLAALFDPGGGAQRCLEDNPRLVPKVSVPPILLQNFLFIPANLLLNGVFGWHENTAPARRFYEERIEQVYYRDAREECGRFKTLRALFWPLFGVPAVPFDDLRGMLEQELAAGNPERPPFFVITTTAAMDRGVEDFSPKLANAAFEFTPVGYGADAFGHRDGSPPVPFGRTVAIAGAALDSGLIAGSPQRTLYSVLNIDLGYYMWNTLNDEVDSGTIFKHRLLPFPTYFAHRYLRDKNGVAIYLTDGGHSDNLALFALVRRMCQRIIVVDAGHDSKCPECKFGEYFRLQRALRGEMGVDLYVPEIEHGRFRPSHPVMRGEVSCLPALGRDGRVPPECARTPPCCHLLHDPASRPRAPAECAACWSPIEVDYVKLSIDPEKLGTYAGTVRTYYDKSTAECHDPSFLRKWVLSCTFPQQPTTDQWFSPDQFAAYRDLGTDIVRHFDDGLLRPEPR